jgi:DNA-binding transcriptional MerR regulator
MKIAEVSERYSISSDTLRYYERIGLIPHVNRNKSGIRDFNEIDVKRVEFIKCMRSAGLPIDVLIEYVGLVQQGDQTIDARKEILKEQRERLVTRMKEMQKTLDILDYKIEVYEKAVLGKEKEIVLTQEPEIIWFEKREGQEVQKRKLGKNGLEVSALWPGCMGMSQSYPPFPGKQEMISFLRQAVERGVTFFDTAEGYGSFVNEELVGEALSPFHDQVVIATKFGFNLDLIARVNLGGLNSQPNHLKQAAQDSGHRFVLTTPGWSGRAYRRRGGGGEGFDPGRQGKAL